MSKVGDGGPAFPSTMIVAEGSNDPFRGDTKADVERRYLMPGMSLRDYFAGQAIGACIEACNADASKTVNGENVFVYSASAAYSIADSMLAARAEAPR